MATATGVRSGSRAVLVARWWWAAIAVVVAGALLIDLYLLFTGGADANSGKTQESVGLGVRLWRLFSFFTIESNLFVLVLAVAESRRPGVEGRGWRVVRLDALLGIVITGLVFAIVLAPQVHLTGGALVATIGFHYVSPWATLAAWLVLGPRPRMDWRTVATAFVWPVLWLVYIFAQGQFTRWYPYPFLDVTKIGLGPALRNAGFVLLLGVVLALLFRLLDRRLPALLRP
ncbi:Pr6Pr family membrane protein [Saccharothrix variisporea]|uniref:FAR-17a/AIG1-like protein n=1 Tax=Saccharothrix variisporea TaxID=543527 RepID=A0A495XMU9_9PSEU|nr:Pr6Pr family membrane protein [Saccharothrix variisporea]RKT74959.1 hypothetical protein DFJ66_8334 [Saccharothrix variisporea]